MQHESICHSHPCISSLGFAAWCIAGQPQIEFTVKIDSKGSVEQKAIAQATCLQTAADHESQLLHERELKVIAVAKQMLADTASRAEAQTYSLFQVVTVSAACVRPRYTIRFARTTA